MSKYSLEIRVDEDHWEEPQERPLIQLIEDQARDHGFEIEIEEERYSQESLAVVAPSTQVLRLKQKSTTTDNEFSFFVISLRALGFTSIVVDNPVDFGIIHPDLIEQYNIAKVIEI